ncbi:MULTISPECIES: NADAR family protein [Clostridium]|uniref:NADAR family protein n=1 Tax=Clostridium TaxID=1485 RepID=UPI0028BD9AFB|nr:MULTISPECIES: NADAR family protein [Clostridium]
MLNGNYAKFIQDEDLRQFLIRTKERVLVEASPYDKIWGIGMSADDENIENPLLWNGANLLVFALMEVRDELIRVCKNYDKLNLIKLHEMFD